MPFKASTSASCSRYDVTCCCRWNGIPRTASFLNGLPVLADHRGLVALQWAAGDRASRSGEDAQAASSALALLQDEAAAKQINLALFADDVRRCYGLSRHGMCELSPRRKTTGPCLSDRRGVSLRSRRCWRTGAAWNC